MKDELEFEHSSIRASIRKQTNTHVFVVFIDTDEELDADERV
jgi:hypothetical protein